MRLLELMGGFARREFRVDVCALSGLRVRSRSVAFVRRRRSFRSTGRLVPPGVSFACCARGDTTSCIRMCCLRRARFSPSQRAGSPCEGCTFSGHGGRLHVRPGAVASNGRSMRQLIDRYATAHHLVRRRVDGRASGGPTGTPIRVAGWSTTAVDPARFHDPVDSRANTGRPRPPEPSRSLLTSETNCRRRTTPAARHFRAITKLAPGPAGAGRRGNRRPEGISARAIAEPWSCGTKSRALVSATTFRSCSRSRMCFCCHHLLEGFPGVVLEACVAGIRCSPPTFPGVREIASRLPLVRYLPLSAADCGVGSRGARIT